MGVRFRIVMLSVILLSSERIIFSYDLSHIPPFAANLAKQERLNREEYQQKEFEETISKVMGGDKKAMEAKAEELVNDKHKLNSFISRLPSEMSDGFDNNFSTKNEQGISLEFTELLQKQYDDPFLKRKKVTLSLRQSGIKDAIELVGKSVGINFIIDEDVTGIIKSVHLEDVSVATALHILLTNNRPKLALLKEHDVWRIALLSNVIDTLSLKYQEEMENDFQQVVVILNNIQFTETLKLNLEKMWHDILGSYFGKSGFYFSCDEHSRKVFFRGRKKYVYAFKDFLKEIDVKIPQIRIEARFVCADKGFEESLGFQFSGVYNRRASIKRGFNFVGAGPLSDIINNPIAQTSASLVDWALNLLPSPDEIAKNIAIPFVFGGNDLNTKRLNVVLNAAENKEEIETILKPSILTNNKEMAEILVGESIPIETVVEESVEGRLRNVQTANYKDIGIQLKVCPIVTPDKKSVFLDIFIENSQEGTKISTDDKYIPITTTRSRSRVLLNSGQTTLISGLIKSINRDEKTNVPLLNKIPVLGWLFKGKRKKQEDRQLMIFITPTVV